jgi:hypothetical protein
MGRYRDTLRVQNGQGRSRDGFLSYKEEEVWVWPLRAQNTTGGA